MGRNNYKPVLLMHGYSISPLNGSFHNWDNFVQFIKEFNPNQLVIALDINNGIDTNKPMFQQTMELYYYIKEIINDNSDSFKDGFHLIGHSQGGLLTRSLIQMYGDDLNIDNYISLAGVQSGSYGHGLISSFFFSNLTNDAITNIMYTYPFQSSNSVANWWYFPLNYQRYLFSNLFLPIINNEIPSKVKSKYKNNFINSIKGSVYAFSSPQDEDLEPWNSAIFGNFDKNLNIINMEDTMVYKNDTFGLKTLSNQGRLNLYSIENVLHDSWLSRKDIFIQYILPLISK